MRTVWELDEFIIQVNVIRREFDDVLFDEWFNKTRAIDLVFAGWRERAQTIFAFASEQLEQRRLVHDLFNAEQNRIPFRVNRVNALDLFVDASLELLSMKDVSLARHTASTDHTDAEEIGELAFAGLRITRHANVELSTRRNIGFLVRVPIQPFLFEDRCIVVDRLVHVLLRERPSADSLNKNAEFVGVSIAQSFQRFQIPIALPDALSCFNSAPEDSATPFVELEHLAIWVNDGSDDLDESPFLVE